MNGKVKELYDSLGYYPGIRKITAETKTVKTLLLETNGETMINGKFWEIRAKSIGAGVWKVWLNTMEVKP